MRKCVGCMISSEKKHLHRIALDAEKKVFIDINGIATGRCAYLCKNIECFDKAIKRKAFYRAFKKEVLKESIDNLSNDIRKYQ